MKFWTNVSRGQGNTLLVRGVEDGERFERKVEIDLVMYVPDPSGPHVALDGRRLSEKRFDSFSEAREFVSSAPVPVYGTDKWVYKYLAEEYRGEVQYDYSMVVVATIDIEVEVGEGFPDPEEAEQPINAIALDVNGQMFAWGVPPDAGQSYAPAGDVTYNECGSEADLLRSFLRLWRAARPDIITGWNVEGFDVPYLVNRIERVLGEEQAKRLSPWNRLEGRRGFIRGEVKEYRAPVGVVVLDYIAMYKKLAVATRAVDTPDNYKLDTIAAHEGVGRKISYSEYDGLMDLYQRDYQTFMEYNVRDVRLVTAIEGRRGLIELVVMKSYADKINYDDAMGSVRPWEQIIYSEMLERGLILPPRGSPTKDELVGAFVKDPEPALYRWIVSEDLDSLYSHLMMQFNISPETRAGQIEELAFRPSPDRDLREQAIEHIDFFMSGAVDKYRDYLVRNDLVVAANGCTYRRKKGLLPVILEKMYDKRRVAKQNVIEYQKRYEQSKSDADLKQVGRWKNSDKVQKTNLNACYGVTTNQYYIFYDHGNAEAITLSGQLAIRWIERRLNGILNEALGTDGVDYVIAIDTDSVYLNLERLVDSTCAGKPREKVCEFVDQVCKQRINPFITESYQQLADYVNAAEQKMNMKRESIADRALWVGKKHYVMNILDKEGVRFAKPKIELKGIAAVKSDTPPAAREALKQAIGIMMGGTEDEVLDLIERVRGDFDRLPFDEIAFSKGIDNLRKYSEQAGGGLGGGPAWKKGTPFQVKAAITYNTALEEHGLKAYPPIFDGDKVKIGLLRQPNPLRSEVVATPGPLPRPFGVEEHLDREAHFQRGFITPLKSLLDVMGWRTERSSSIEDFFA